MIVLFLLKEALALSIFLIAFIYVWFQYKFSYWKKKRVFGPKPVFPFGNIRDVIRRKKQFFQPYIDCYKKYKDVPYVGMYCFGRPVLSINDPEVAKLILIKDFEHFQSHGIYSGGPADKLAGHLFNNHGQAWKNLRAKMSPTFTAGKLKGMYSLVEDKSKEALKYAQEIGSGDQAIDFSDFYAKYMMEVVGSVGFGIECNGFKMPNSDFSLRANEYFETKSTYWTIVRAIAFFAPNFFNMLQIKRISSTITNFFCNLVEETVEYRKKNSYYRNDFLQTLIELKDGKVIDENGEKIHTQDFPFSMKDMISNTMLYLFAGYETSAVTGQFAAFELARHPGIQAIARKQVKEVLANYGGQCTYEAQNEMTYLNMVLDETMRMHPPLRALFRSCTKEYRLPKSNLVIDEGTLIFVPIEAIQMDPDYFPDPDRFEPERFSPENKGKLHPCHWMPFGEGPRKCLGLRQGYIQSKLALAKLLDTFELILDERTKVPVTNKPTFLSNIPEGGIWIKLRRLEDS